jgi:ATP synthase F1 delta subunit
MKDRIVRNLVNELVPSHATENVHVYTAIQLQDEQKAEMVKLLEDALQVRVEAEFHIQKDIIGGVVIKTSHQLLDASVKQQLDDALAYMKQDRK